MTLIKQNKLWTIVSILAAVPLILFLGQAIAAGFSQEVMEELVGQTGDWKKPACGLV